MNNNYYKGYREVSLTNDKMADFYSNPNEFGKELEMKENEYLLVCDETGSVVDKYCYQNGFFRNVKFLTIENDYCGVIKPRNIYQQLTIDMLQDNTSAVKVVRGVYGAGKEVLMFNEALAQIDKGRFQKIIFIRPNVTVADVPDIGYLKGDLEDKLDWTLAPIYDKVGGRDGVDRLISLDLLEMAPLLFIRGRSFENSLIYVTEGQNMTTEIVKLLISRVGEGSNLWINGDNHQTDRRVYDRDNGITRMIEKLSGNPLFAYTYLPITERGAVADLANLLDD